MQANPNKITSYYVDLAPGSSLDLGNQNGYPRIAATAPGRSVVVAQVRVAYRPYKTASVSPCITDPNRDTQSKYPAWRCLHTSPQQHAHSVRRTSHGTRGSQVVV